jgi:hypothetical protein
MKKQKSKHIKPQYGVTYECYIGCMDNNGARVRKGQRYYLYTEFGTFYAMQLIKGNGYTKSIDKDKFTSHFIPLNSLT